MHGRVPQERGKSCRLPPKFGKGKADPKLQAHLIRASVGWERSTEAHRRVSPIEGNEERRKGWQDGLASS